MSPPGVCLYSVECRLKRLPPCVVKTRDLACERAVDWCILPACTLEVGQCGSVPRAAPRRWDRVEERWLLCLNPGARARRLPLPPCVAGPEAVRYPQDRRALVVETSGLVLCCCGGKLGRQARGAVWSGCCRRASCNTLGCPLWVCFFGGFRDCKMYVCVCNHATNVVCCLGSCKPASFASLPGRWI